MNKKDLISKTTEVLRNNNIRKPVSSPKQVFHISDEEGNHKDFIVRKTDKSVLYTTNDVSAVIEACLTVIEDSITHGEDVSIHGFGTLGVHQRAARTTKHPNTGEVVEVRARYVPKFSFGKCLRVAARLYELSLKDTHIELPPPMPEEDEGGDS